MFYVAEALLLSKGLAYSKHSAVIASFGKEFAKTGILPTQLHTRLRAASEARNISDYQTVSHLTEAETLRHVSHAADFLAAAETFLKPRRASRSS